MEDLHQSLRFVNSEYNKLYDNNKSSTAVKVYRKAITL